MRLTALAFSVLWLAASAALAFDTTATTALVIDHRTGAVLLAKNERTPMPPASMSKLMTLNMLFEALADGRLDMEDRFTVSEKAWRMEGSRMFLEVGKQVRVSDLVRGIIVQSGNDACVVVAENLAVSEAAFSERMNERAAALGMTDSHFTNSSGWPDPRHRMSARDLVLLAQRLINVFPQYYGFFSETEFEWNNVRQRNRNPLLSLKIGADGLKTGHTEEAGYGLVGSAVRDGQRIVFVISGLASMTAREEEAERLTNWAFREFTNRTLFAKGAVLTEAEVWLGSEATVPLIAPADILATIPFGKEAEVRLRIVYQGPVPAPVAEGQEIARLLIEAPGLAPVSTPLVAARAVTKGGYFTRLTATAGSLIGQLVGAD